MKKNLRVLLAVLLALTFVGTFALFGCAPEEKPAEEQTESSQPAENAQPAPEPEQNDSTETVELQIFAANSLTMALAEVQELYSDTHEGIVFADTQFEASGTLVESLTAGSYADLLITASKGTMDTAEEGTLVDMATRFDMFANDLVIVAAEDSAITEATLEDIAAGTYTVAVGDDAVPAGNYAAQALSTVGAYEDPSGETGSKATGKEGSYVGITPALESSVGNVAKKAEAGEVDVAIVYSSDVYRFGGVKIVGTIAAEAHKPIIYPAAITVDSKNAEAVQEFLDWAISDPEAVKIWQAWGFELIA